VRALCRGDRVDECVLRSFDLSDFIEDRQNRAQSVGRGAFRRQRLVFRVHRKANQALARGHDPDELAKLRR
jgi:hypothetical protein